MSEKIFLLSKSRKNKILLLDILIFLLLLIFTIFIYIFFENLRSLIIFVPVILFIVYKAFLFSKRDAALIICSRRIYSWRSGWFADKEIKRVYLGNYNMGTLKNENHVKCILLDLNFGWYAPTVYSDWSLYSLPSTVVLACQDDLNEPIDQVFDVLRESIKSA